MGYKVNNISVMDSSDTQGDFRADFNIIIAKRIERPGNSTTNLDYAYQGENYGYSSGGTPFSSPYTNNSMGTIDQFSFASDGNGTDHGDLNASGYGAGSVNSMTNAYLAGGYIGPWGSGVTDTIQKFPFAASAPVTASDTGYGVNASNYAFGGNNNASFGYFTGGGFGDLNYIYKFVFASEADTTDIGNLTQARGGVASSSSLTHGYSAGGFPYGYAKIIDKFPFAVDGDASGVGNLVQYSPYVRGGSSSTTHGYSAGGGYYNNYIQKYPFATDDDASDIGDLVNATTGTGGHSSTTHGYSTGGVQTGNWIQKYSFASDQNGTDIGDLTVNRGSPAGNHS